MAALQTDDLKAAQEQAKKGVRYIEVRYIANVNALTPKYRLHSAHIHSYGGGFVNIYIMELRVE